MKTVKTQTETLLGRQLFVEVSLMSLNLRAPNPVKIPSLPSGGY